MRAMRDIFGVTLDNFFEEQKITVKSIYLAQFVNNQSRLGNEWNS